jgi:hypothetical protein
VSDKKEDYHTFIRNLKTSGIVQFISHGQKIGKVGELCVVLQ